MAVKKPFLPLILLIIVAGTIHAQAVPYDYSFTQECLATPLGAQYGGGIAANPEVDDGLNGWTQIADATVQTSDGNNYFVASVAIDNQTSTVQDFQLDQDKLYTFSVWVQVSEGNAYVEAVFTTQSGNNITAGWVAAQQGCWSMLKGGIVVDASGPAHLFFKSHEGSAKAQIFVDSISLQPFTQEEWTSHQNQSVEQVRKSRVKFQVVDKYWGSPKPNATVFINQTRPEFPFGSAINGFIVNSTAYQNWFTSRFRYGVFENEMKWYNVEAVRDQPDYSKPDAMVEFVKSKNITIRGHTVHWDTIGCFPDWFIASPTNNTDEFLNITYSRIESLVNRYKGQVIHWDVVNENMHSSYMEDKLGPNGSALHYSKVHEVDPNALLFLNEFMTIEKSADKPASPWKYLQKIADLRKNGYNGPLGIGLQAHFGAVPNLPYARASLDVLTSANLPIWITELDVKNNTGANQANYLNQIIRELHAHQGVQGMLLWTGINSEGLCWMMCLTDKDFNNLPTGDVVDKIIAEWTHADGVQGSTDANGYFETSLFHGQYEVSVGGNQSQQFNVVPNQDDAQILEVKILA